MFTYINNKPQTGVIAGIGSGLIYFIKTLLTDDLILKVVAGIGIWIGLVVALLTMVLKVIEILKTRIKIK